MTRPLTDYYHHLVGARKLSCLAPCLRLVTGIVTALRFVTKSMLIHLEACRFEVPWTIRCAALHCYSLYSVLQGYSRVSTTGPAVWCI